MKNRRSVCSGQKRLKRLSKLLFLWIGCLLVLSTSIQAAESSESTHSESPGGKRGRIELVLEAVSEGRSVENAEFEVFQAASLQEDRFVYPKEVENCSLQPEDLQHPEAVQKTLDVLSKAREEKKLASIGTLKTDEEGKAFLETEKSGLFLLHPVHCGQYGHVKDALLALPNAHEETGVLNWTAEIHPKAEPMPRIQIEKTDPKGQPILNLEFEFSAWSDEKKTEVIAAAPGNPKTGTAEFFPEPGQTLWIGESAAPKGYVLSDQLICVELTRDGVLKVDGKEQSKDQLTVHIPYVNEPEQERSEEISSVSQSGSSPDRTGGTPSSKNPGAHTAAHTGLYLLLVLFYAAWLAGTAMVIYGRPRSDGRPMD